MADCPFPEIPEIFKTECIGNSLFKINSNFGLLKTYADTNCNKITNLEEQAQDLSSKITTLSGYLVPGVAKAWVKFDGTRKDEGDVELVPTTSNRFIYNSYNVKTVYRYGLGQYQITFEAPFLNSNYLLVGTSSQKQASTGLYTWLQPIEYRTVWATVRVTGINTASTVDAEHISVVVY